MFCNFETYIFEQIRNWNLLLFVQFRVGGGLTFFWHAYASLYAPPWDIDLIHPCLTKSYCKDIRITQFKFVAKWQNSVPLQNLLLIIERNKILVMIRHKLNSILFQIYFIHIYSSSCLISLFCFSCNNSFLNQSGWDSSWSSLT